jgi:ATP:ADP antiporter, AAA family
MIIPFLQSVVRPIFGAFEREEFKKFLRMGVIFACIIGSYWTLRVLKDSVFINLVGKGDIWLAKLVSLVCLFPLIMLYTKLLDRLSREKMFYVLATVYGIATIVFGLLILSSQIGQAPAIVIAAREGLPYYLTKILGYGWYVFVESYGSLIVALFWAIASDTTEPDSAKKGFSLVVAIGQIGGIVGPLFITRLPKMIGFSTSALSIFICALLVLVLIVLMRYFFRKTPKHLMVSFHGKNEEQIEKEQEPGFLEGLKLLLQHKYLLGIFGVITFYEIIVTVFDFHFKNLAGTHYTGTDLDAYLGSYGSLVNTVALVCLLLGINNITRIFGVGVALALMPVIVGGALFGFLTIDSLNFLFYLMVGSKAINYALNGPAMKQLYIPTTPDVRFKSQAWIETFGSRGSKGIGSGFNSLLKPFQKTFGEVAGRLWHIKLSSYIGFAIVGLWFLIAVYLGKTYKQAIDQKKVVC